MLFFVLPFSSPLLFSVSHFSILPSKLGQEHSLGFKVLGHNLNPQVAL
jgi:hypothetical protein